VTGAVRGFQDSLDWLGLKFDEGPTTGGAHGPYIQARSSVFRLRRHKYSLICNPELLGWSRSIRYI